MSNATEQLIPEAQGTSWSDEVIEKFQYTDVDAVLFVLLSNYIVKEFNSIRPKQSGTKTHSEYLSIIFDKEMKRRYYVYGIKFYNSPIIEMKDFAILPGEDSTPDFVLDKIIEIKSKQNT